MAPTIPKKRPSIRSKTSKTPATSTETSSSIYVPRPRREDATISDEFISSKKDKRQIKHSAFMNRIQKSQKKPLKRRRPSKKLVTTLSSLADSLPNIEGLVQESRGEKEGKIKMKSLRSKPGALKRKEKLERGERERFGRNMAQILSPDTSAHDGGVDGTAKSKVSGRFAALRAWAEANMEKHPAFEKGK